METKTLNQTNAGDKQIPYMVFNEIKQNIEYYQNIQLNVIYNKLHNDKNLDFSDEIKNSKTLSEKILYFYASKGIELRTFDIKKEYDIAGMYINKTDKRVRVRYANSPNQKETQDNYKTLAKTICFLKANGLSPQAFKTTFANSSNYHAHHPKENVTIDTETSVQLLHKKQHINHHSNKKPIKKTSDELFDEFMGYKSH